MKKQARLWTDKEVDLIKEALQFYANNDYPLEQSFEYVVTLHTKGQGEAQALIDSLTPQRANNTPTSPQIDYLEGIQKDTKTLIDMLSDMQGNIPDKDKLLQLQTETDNKEVNELENERDKLLDKITQLENEVNTYKKELDYVKTLNMFSFGKWKKENN